MRIVGGVEPKTQNNPIGATIENARIGVSIPTRTTRNRNLSRRVTTVRVFDLNRWSFANSRSTPYLGF